MKISPQLMRWIASQQNNYLLIALITFGFPRLFLRSIYRHNLENRCWNGRRTCVTLSFDCDYPDDVEAIPDLLNKLKPYSYKASFACVGYWIEKYPKAHAMILEEGHEIVNHTYTHPDNDILTPGRKFKLISRDEKMDEILKCHDVCRKILGYKPQGLRVPHFKHLFTEEIYGMLKEIGYRYSSSTWVTGTTTYGQPFRERHGIVEFPLSNCPLHPFTVFDTWHSLNAPQLSHRLIHRGTESYCRLFEELVAMGEETGSYINIYMDPLDIKKLSGFGTFLERLNQPDRFLVATYEDIIRDPPAADFIKVVT